jgi:hypothetical protein
MARSKEDIISEMVDSGLFSDEEIKNAVKSSKSLETIKSIDILPSIVSGAKKIYEGTTETLMPPKNIESLKRLMDVRAGQYGLSRTAQKAGEYLSKAAEKAVMSEKTPKAVKLLYKYRPGDLTPSSFQEQIGSVPIAEGISGIVGKAITPVLKPIGRGVSSLLERTSGLSYKTPGILKEVYRDPSLFLAGGTEKVKPIYTEAKKAAGKITGLIGEEGHPSLIRNVQTVRKALSLAKEGKLNPSEAQVARRAVDALGESGSYEIESVKNLRDYFDKIAKSSEQLKAADVAYSRAKKAEALREVFPVSKGGGTSIMKLVTGLGAAKFLNPAGIVLDALLLSPAVQGIASIGAGTVYRALGSTPSSVVLGNLIRESMKRRSNNRGNK